MKGPCAAVIASFSMVSLSVLVMPADRVNAGGFGRAEIGGSKLKPLSPAQVAKTKVLMEYLRSLEAKRIRRSFTR